MIGFIETVGIAVCGIYLIYIFLHAVALIGSKKFKSLSTKAKITVVVPFRNEKQSLPLLLASIDQLDYPREQFEVILVDDHSSDGSETLDLSAYSFPVKIIPSSGEGKKAAVTAAVQVSNYKIIAQTDADCQLPELWLQHIAGMIEDDYDMVCGGVLFYNSDLQNLELLSYLGIGKASARMKAPILANGANLAYRKSVFEEVGGFEANATTSSGDDVFLMQSFSRAKKKIGFLLNPSHIVKTRATKRLREFLDQRVRWAGKTAKTGSVDTILASIIIFLTNAFVVFEIVLVGIQGVEDEVGLIALLSKFVIDFLFLFLVAQRVKLYRPLLYFPVSAPCYSLYIVLVVIISVFYRPEWKNRTIHI